MNSLNPVLRPMDQADCAEVASVHLESFPNFFLSFLGRSFLELLYLNICCAPEGVAFVAMAGQRTVGFVAGVTEQAGFFRKLITQQKWRFARAALRATLRKPKIVPRLVRALWHPQGAEKSSANACLMSIAVLPEVQGLGVGMQLVEAFCHELAKRGVRIVCLTTDRDRNEMVNAFYQRMGFDLVRSYVTPEGRAMNEFAKKLRDA